MHMIRRRDVIYKSHLWLMPGSPLAEDSNAEGSHENCAKHDGYRYNIALILPVY